MHEDFNNPLEILLGDKVMKMKDIQDKWWFNVFIVGILGYVFYLFVLILVIAVFSLTWPWGMFAVLLWVVLQCVWEWLTYRRKHKRIIGGE